MNVVYRLVWNRTRKLWVVASELARARHVAPRVVRRAVRYLLAGLFLSIAFASHAQVLQWDGAGPPNDGVINGGSGTWIATGGLAWTDATGTANSAWVANANAVFGGASGLVTVDTSAGAVLFNGLQFASDGYVLNGGVLTPNLASTAIAVGSGLTATIASAMQGTGGINKTDTGTLILSGANTYSGGTTITAGTLQFGNGGTTGSFTGNVTNNASLVFNRSDTVTVSGVISGTGSVTQAGPGTTTILSQNTYTGGTIVNAGTLQIGNTPTTDYGSTPAGLIRGAVTVNPGGTLLVTGRNAMGSSGTPSTNVNAVTLLNATMTHTGTADNGWGVAYDLTGSTMQTTGTGQFSLGGPSTANPTTLHIHASNTSSVIAGRIRLRENEPGNQVPFTVDDGAAAIDLLVSADIDQNGAQGMLKQGAGTMALSGLSSWTGTLTIAQGTLQVGNGGASGNLSGSVVDNAALVFNRSDNFTHAGVISGTGSVAQSGAGTLVLNATNTYTGGTILNSGILSTSNDANLGAAAGTLTFNGGTLLTPAALTIARNGTMLSTGIIDNGGTNDTFSGVFAGSGGVTFSGSATTLLTGNHTYTGTTTISDGTLQLGNGGTSGAVVGPIVDNGVLQVNRSNTVVFNAPISGSGSLLKTGAGTTVLAADNTYTGGTTISAGTLQIGNGGTTGHLVGPVVNNAALTFALTGTSTFDGAISGTGSITQNGSGTVTLTGPNSYTATTTVNAGRLNISGNQGAATGTVTVNSGATLGGIGTTGGSIVVNDGGRIAPGQSAGTLSTLGNLALAPGAFLDYELGQANVVGGTFNDLLTVGGNLTLDGTLNVSLTPGGAFLGGVYRIINYGGTLTDNGLALGTMPSAGPFFVQTAVANQVNLVNAEGLGPLTFWDGANASLYNNAAVNGGSGTWLASPTGAAWTDAGGTANAPWQNGGFAVFQASPGTVTVDNSAGAIVFSGAQFATGGYVLTGQPLTTTTAATALRVGDGTPAGAAMTATISNVIQGSGGIDKTDLGTLVLSGTNTYSGGTTASGGVLSISSDANLGDAAGALTFNGGTLRTTAALSSARTMNVAGNGTIDNAGNNDTFSGTIGGAGAMTFAGAGTTVLATDATYTGGTTIASGTLQLGNGGASGSIVGNVVDNGTLSVVRSGNVALAGAISGTGSLIQSGTGITTLSGANSYTGTTTVAAGTLRIDGNQATATGPVNVGAGATLTGIGTSGGDVALADNARLAGVQGQTLAMDSLALSPSSQIDASLSGPGTTALFAVNGNGGGPANLVLDGVLNVTATGAFGPGVYRLIDYGGALTDNGLGFGTVPAGHTANVTLRAQTAVAQQVNLVNSLGAALTFWDGGNPAVFDNLAIDGGSGTWLASGGLSWTDSAGTFNAAWQQGGFAVFQGTPGTVTVDGSAGAVAFSGAQFAVDGYAVTGAPLTTTTGNTVVRVGDGTAASASMTATIASTIAGTGGVDKTDLGTLVLSGINTYSGGTTIAGGTLSIGDDANLGDTSGALTFNAGRLLTTGAVNSARNVSLPGSATIDNGGNTDTFGGVFDGPGALAFAGSGTSILTADNTNTGTASISSGSTLQLGNGATTGGVGDSIALDGVLVFFRSENALDITTPITGAGVIRLRGTGVVNQSGYRVNPASGDFRGAVIVESGARLTLLASPLPGAFVVVENNGGLNLDIATEFASRVFLQGNGWPENAGQLGALRLAGNAIQSGPVTLTGDARMTAFSAGVHGTVSGAIDDAGNAFDLEKTGEGSISFSGDNTYTGTTTVSAGTLFINGTHASPSIRVLNTATLGGSGTLAGSIDVADGGRIAPGNSAGTLTAQGALTLAAGSVLDYELGQANVPGGPLNDLLAIGGDLTLDGTLNVAVTPGGALLGGVYRIIGYGGALTDNGLALGSMPAGGPFFVQTAVANQVNLVNTEGLGPLTFWDGADASLYNNGAVNGGSGTWLASPTDASWADVGGVANASWQADGFAIFQAAPGTVTVDDSAGSVAFSGAQFAVDGYAIVGAALTSNTADTQIRVGDGTAAGASMTATIDAPIQGNATLRKTDLGTLALTGTNAYTGGTIIDEGTLAIDADASLGDAAGGLTIDGGTLSMLAPVTSARAITIGLGGATIDNGGNANLLSGVIAGDGALIVASGTLTLAADDTYAGGTTVQAGTTLQLGNGATSGSLIGNVIDNGTLAFNRSDVFTFAGIVSGSGVLEQRGTGTTVLTGDEAHGGGTLISAGTLQLGDGGGTGSVPGDVTDNGALVVNRNDAITLGGTISGTGTFTQQGTGTTTLTGANRYAGTTTVAAGTLLIDGAQGAATGAVSVAAGATLGGIGTTGGAVSVADAGHLLGSQGQVFHLDTLALAPTSQVDVTLTAPGTIGLFEIDGNGGGTGNLLLDGQLNITAAGAFGPGVYRVMQYAGALTDNGLEFGTVPAGFTPNVDLFVQTAVAQQVNLINAQSEGPLTFWDGDDAALHDNGAVNGGNGTWRAAGDFAWTGSTGAVNTP